MTIRYLKDGIGDISDDTEVIAEGLTGYYIATDNPDKEFMVAEVLDEGYRLRNGSDHEVIVPSKVKIYKHVEQE